MVFKYQYVKLISAIQFSDKRTFWECLTSSVIFNDFVRVSHSNIWIYRHFAVIYYGYLAWTVKIKGLMRTEVNELLKFSNCASFPLQLQTCIFCRIGCVSYWQDVKAMLFYLINCFIHYKLYLCSLFNQVNWLVSCMSHLT